MTTPAIPRTNNSDNNTVTTNNDVDNDTDQPTTITGSCLCQFVRYTLHGTRLTCVICACNNCRRTSGSTFSHIQHYKDATLTLAADSVAHARKYEDSATGSGNVTQRWFCGKCGSQLYGYSPTFKLYILRVGAMDDECAEKALRPMGASFGDRLPDWVREFPAMTEYPKVVQYFMSLMGKT